MVFKHKETGDEFITDNENVFSMLEREGYEPVEEKEETKTKKK